MPLKSTTFVTHITLMSILFNIVVVVVERWEKVHTKYESYVIFKLK